MILAGDIGGTKTNLALFEREGVGRVGPVRDPESFRSADFGSLAELIEVYRSRHRARVDIVSLGVAGPVILNHVRGTNLPWEVHAAAVSRLTGMSRVYLLNDLAATGYSIPALLPEDLETIQEGIADPGANAGLLAPGTGLGESTLFRAGSEWIPIASEGGHADFAPRTDEEIELFRALRESLGRVSYEHVLSGPGLVRLARWSHGSGEGADAWKRHEGDASGEELPALVSQAALDRACSWCVEALDHFVSIYGAEAGNLALRGVTWAGVFLGGGISPKILPALHGDRFLNAFREKEPYKELLSKIPVRVIRNDRAAVLGAARYATLGAPL